MSSDETLARQVQRGHQPSLITLVERHHNPLLGFLYRLTGGDRTLAEDLVQETFLRVLRSIGQYVYPRPFKPWLYTIATNLARDYYKRAERHQTVTVPDTEESGGPEWWVEDEEWTTPGAALLLADEAREVARALQRLPEGQREAVVLRYYQELSLNEIAQVLNLPVGTVKSRLSIALQRLRVILEEGNRDGR